MAISIERKTRVIEGVKADAVPYDDLLAVGEPVILRNLVGDWPLVKIGLESTIKSMEYIKSFYREKKIVSYKGKSEIKGRFFYNEDLTALNFESRILKLDEFLDEVASMLDRTDAPSLYIGSSSIDTYLPGFRAENDLALNSPMFDANPPLASIWLGNKTVAAAHYDLSNNMACCAVGRRRFTLFPPEQIDNLYPGPLEPTPGGQVVSTVDFQNPDFSRHPRFKAAMEAGQVADLFPGDLLFYPSMWWHQVEALDGFNVLINYWWNTSPAYVDTPANTLLHALLSLRERPVHEKAAWRAVFEYYIFGPKENASDHLPEHARGILNGLDDVTAKRLRATLLNRLNR
jgi:hypothetical protein